MNDNTKRMFSALATVSLLTITILSIVTFTAVPVSAQNQVVISGQTTGNLNDRLSYSATVQDCRETTLGQLTKDCDPVPGGSVQFRFVSPAGGTAIQSVTTNTLGVASTSFTPNLAGTWQISATSAGITSNTLQVSVINPAVAVSPTVAPTAQPSGGNGQASVSGNGAASTTPSTTVAGIGDVAAQVEAATGLGSNWLLTVLAVIIIVILAIIATALLMRRREKD